MRPSHASADTVLDGAALSGGFADPVFDAQRVFRAALDALSRPGTVVPLDVAANPPAPLSPTAAALVLALADADTPVWLDAALAGTAAVGAYLAFHAGIRTVASPADAAFAVLSDPAAMPPLTAFATGTADYPDRSTTLVLQVATLAATAAPDCTPLVLAGPGIAETARLSVAPLPPGLDAAWAANRALYPCGVDVLLAGPATIAGLPRTVRLLDGENGPCT